jgi:hypothetical protein
VSFIFQPPSSQSQEKDTKKKKLKESEPESEVSHCYGNNIKLPELLNMGMQHFMRT